MQTIRSLSTTGDSVMANLDLFNRNLLRFLHTHDVFAAMPNNSSLEFSVCGVGEVSLSKTLFFVVLSTQGLTKVPGDLNAMIVPEGMEIRAGDKLRFSRDDSVESTLGIEIRSGDVRSILVGGQNRHFALCHVRVEYKKVKGYFELTTIDGRSVS
jgi:hypothetical protein